MLHLYVFGLLQKQKNRSQGSWFQNPGKADLNVTLSSLTWFVILGRTSFVRRPPLHGQQIPHLTVGLEVKGRLEVKGELEVSVHGRAGGRQHDGSFCVSYEIQTHSRLLAEFLFNCHFL